MTDNQKNEREVIDSSINRTPTSAPRSEGRRPWRPRPGGRTVLALAAVAAAGLLAACSTTGVGDAAPPGPTIGSETVVDSTVEQISTGDTGSDAEASTDTDSETGELATSDPSGPDAAAERPVGLPLPPLSTAADIKAAVEEVHGPTSDIAGQMNRFVDFPSITTPTLTVLTELRADIRNTDDGRWILASSEVTFTTEGTAEDLTSFFEQDFERLGWERSNDSANIITTGPIRRSGFRQPGSEYALDDVELTIIDSPGSFATSFPRSEVRLRYVALEPVTVDSVRRRFEGWVSDIPLPEGGEVTGAGIQTTSLGRRSIHYFLDLDYEGVEAVAVAAELRDRLPINELEVDPKPASGDALDNWVYLTSPFFTDLWVSTHERLSGAGGIRTVVNVDARVDFDPSGG